MSQKPRSRSRIWLRFEQLESRLTPSASDVFNPMIVAGDADLTPTDSPSARVDANTTTSYFTGVGSVQTTTRRGTFIGTGTILYDSSANYTYVLTAAHVVDISNDGKLSSKDGVSNFKFWMNIGGDQNESFTLSGSAIYDGVFIHPQYTGFNRPSINDDLAVIRFAGTQPAAAQSYSVYTGSIAGSVLTMVGYGRSGYGDVGYTTNASWNVKRVGQNTADAFYGQDDAGAPAADEVFRYDFDGPTGIGAFGGPTLGNDVETTIGGGDSGGPSFVWIDGAPTIAGVNTYTLGLNAPKFGSQGGGIAVGPYVSWLESVVPGLGTTGAGTPQSAPSEEIAGTGNQASVMIAMFEVLLAEDGLRARTVNRSFVSTGFPNVTVRFDAAPVNRTAAPTPTTVASVFQTNPLVEIEQAAEEAEPNPDANPVPDGAAAPMLAIRPRVQTPRVVSVTTRDDDSNKAEAKALALRLIDNEAVPSRAQSSDRENEHGALNSSDAADSMRDWLIPHSTAALAALFILAGGRQGIARDEEARKSTPRSRFALPRNGASQ